jgi:hypothetical protein
MSDTAEALALNRVVEALAIMYPSVAPELINEKVRRAHEQFTNAPIRDFVPVLVERQVRADLAVTP